MGLVESLLPPVLPQVYSYAVGTDLKETAYYSRGMCANKGATCQEQEAAAKASYKNVANWRCMEVQSRLFVPSSCPLTSLL